MFLCSWEEPPAIRALKKPVCSAAPWWYGLNSTSTKKEGSDSQILVSNALVWVPRLGDICNHVTGLIDSLEVEGQSTSLTKPLKHSRVFKVFHFEAWRSKNLQRMVPGSCPLNLGSSKKKKPFFKKSLSYLRRQELCMGSYTLKSITKRIAALEPPQVRSIEI